MVWKSATTDRTIALLGIAAAQLAMQRMQNVLSSSLSVAIKWKTKLIAVNQLGYI